MNMSDHSKMLRVSRRRRAPAMACFLLFIATALSIPELSSAQLTLSPSKSFQPTPSPIEDPPEGSPTTPPLVTNSPTPPLVVNPTSPPLVTKSPTENPSVTLSTPAPSEAVPVTDRPTFSSPPTKAPIQPTSAPTDVPPTAVPTTRSPSESPTTKPTDEPTASPTSVPTTRQPTKSPTPKPSTSAPTKAPTGKPTRNPTAKPTPFPTTLPTLFPSLSPIAPPTDQPTGSPVTFPTTYPPTKSPTLSPTPSPSKSPTLSPTKSPTPSPTKTPSTSPTIAPTGSPNELPTTESPTDFPTPAPSMKPSTSSTTIFPTQGETQQATTKLLGPITTTNVKMTLYGVNEVDDPNAWSRTTATFIQDWLNDDIASLSLIQKAIYDARVTVTLTSTTQGEEVRGRRRLGRNLQTDSVEVTYNQITTYRTRDPNIDIERIVVAPFESQTSRDQYIKALKEALDGYEELTEVSPVTISADDSNGDGDKSEGSGDESSGGSTNMAAIIGGACGGAAALVLLGGFIYMRKRNNNESLSGGEVNSTKSQSGPQDPISSGTSSVPTYGDQSVATVDYDYSKAYGGAGNYSLSDAGGTLGSHTRQTASDPRLLPGADNATIYSDDPTFDQAYDGVREELLDIYAPPGKLGVVIDTPDDGAPVVHAVKDTSPIADKVQVGDKLVAVDDEDVRAMTAIKVSKLISRKSTNASRKLTIIRYVNP